MPTDSSQVTLVMYHYVRDLENSAYPNIKGLSLEKFDRQLDYLQNHYTIIGAHEIQEALKGAIPLPPNACHLTFDDGFLDHYETVLPRLLKRGVRASFYPPVLSIKEKRVLDTHKIHFILASSPSSAIRNEIFERLDHRQEKTSLPDNATLYAEFGKENRLDTADTVFVKAMLQMVLPDNLRKPIVDDLFRRFVSDDERGFAEQLYMSIAHLRDLIGEQMAIGGHGYEHKRLGSLSDEEQNREIDRTFDFLCELHGGKIQEWIMCYPYGSYNYHTLQTLKSRGTSLGLTTKVEIADLNRPLEMGRLDTNDIPS